MTDTDNTEKLHPVVKRCITDLLAKARSSEGTEVDKAEALGRARRLMAQQGLTDDDFLWVGEEPGKVRRYSHGISALIRELILIQPAWSYRQIAEEVRRQIPTALTTASTVCSHSKVMRGFGIMGTIRERKRLARSGPEIGQ